MTRYALIQNGTVATVVEQHTTPEVDGVWERCGDAGPGWTYDGAFHPPVASTQPKHITQFAFRTRVGDDIVAGMELGARYNAADSEPVQMAKAVSRARQARTFAAAYIDLDNAELRVAFADAAAEDFARIFEAEVQQGERP